MHGKVSHFLYFIHGIKKMKNKGKRCHFLQIIFFTIFTKTKQDIEKRITHEICKIKF